MNPMVEEYIAKQKTACNAQKEEDKQAFLLRIGMSQKAFQGPDDDPYDFPEYDPDTRSYYRLIPIDVTDEEYEALKNASKLTKKPVVDEETESSFLPGVLLYISICVFIAGFFLGFYHATNPDLLEHDVNFSLAIAMDYWGSYFFSGIMILCIRRVIVLLEQIRDK